MSRVFGKTILHLLRGYVCDTDSDSFFLRYSDAADLGQAPAILALVIFNVSLTIISTMYVVVLVFRRSIHFKTKKVEEWGDAAFGPTWDAKRDEFMARTGPFWLLEFLISFPRERRSYWKSFLISALHVCFIVLCVAPLLLAAALFHAAIHEEYGVVTPIPWFSLALYIICCVYAFVALVYLTVYYAQMSWTVMRVFSYGFFSLLVLVVVLDMIYMVNLTYWIILGALIKPNEILPFASVIVVLLFHGIATARRVHKLSQQADQDAILETEKAAAESVQIKGAVSAAQAVSMVQKVGILEQRDLTIRQQVIREITIFSIMVLFFAFLLTGFTALKTGDMSTAVSSLMVFAVGGGVNSPTVTDTEDHDKTLAEKVAESRDKKKKED
jgi:hypothetical protein